MMMTPRPLPVPTGPLLACRQLSRSFGQPRGLFRRHADVKVVEDITLEAWRGETLAIVGESGSGKTTLARMLMGSLVPTAGDVLIDGAPIATLGRGELARRLQPVFQDPYSSLNPCKTLLQIIGLPLHVRNDCSAVEREARVLALMERVGLPRRLAHSHPSQLSGGQRQRVSIARALVVRPDIVVLDEPTSALDVSVQAQILNLLQELKREFGLTYVFISHNLAVVEHMADRLAVMHRGRLVEYGDSAAVFAAPREAYTRELLAAELTL